MVLASKLSFFSTANTGTDVTMAASLRYRSFCLGIIITSLTWTIVLYLYSTLVSEAPISADTQWKLQSHNRVQKDWIPNKESLDSKLRFLLPTPDKRLNMIEAEDVKNDLYYKNNRFQNSKDLIAHLQPKPLHILKKSDTMDLDELGLVRTPQDQKKREEGYRKHAFNVLVSSRLSYHRDIPDTRHNTCKKKLYRPSLPPASIIICFFNEDKDTLFRTIHSVVDRSPDQFLHEVLLVDDNSEIEGLHKEIQEYISKTFTSKVVLLKTYQREGLIRARMFGAKHATGEVLVFLDSHVEVNIEWLQPLLDRIADNRTSVVIPIIDIISPDTFAYTASPLVRGGFNWGLHFKWDSLPTGTLKYDNDYSKPVRSPTMAGGLFAIDRKYFHKIGEYDPGMDIWGGENLEISFRVWMCGGNLEIIPCSRVGHIFRKRRPYGSPNGIDTMTRNSLRVAHVWMDEYKEYFFQIRPDARNMDYGNIKQRLQLREELKCHSFSWYMKNVYPELQLPTENRQQKKDKVAAQLDLQKRARYFQQRNRNYISKYKIRLSGTNLCIQSEEEVTTKGSLLLLKQCEQIQEQIWYETDKNELVLGQMLCLNAEDQFPQLSKCHEMGGNQEWKHTNEKETPLYSTSAGMCLGVQRQAPGAYVLMEICANSQATKWNLVGNGR